MQVATYISDLLFRHECVVIPDFGAIVSRRVPAQYFDSTHTLYPPKKGLSFNEQIRQNDGLLVQYIVSVEQIPYDAALQQIRNYVRFLNHEIDTKGSVTAPKIGRFTRNEEQALQFLPMYLVNYLPESFGLASHEAFAVDRTPVIHLPAEVIEQIETEEFATASEQIENPVVELESLKTAKSNAGSWVRYAAVGAVLIAGSYFGFMGYQNQVSENELAVEMMAEEQFRNKVQEASFVIDNPLPSIKLQVDAIDDIVKSNTIATPVYTSYKNYHVIAGAYRNPVNANNRIAELRKLGYQAKRIGVNKYGLHNVAFSSHDSRNAATNELYRLQKNGFEGAWLLVGKL